MKKSVLIIITAIIIIAAGFTLGFLMSQERICTELACLCLQNFTEPFTGDLPCNSCEQINPIFVGGLFSLVSRCEAREIMLCDSGQEAGVRYNIEGSCKFHIAILNPYGL